MARLSSTHSTLKVRNPQDLKGHTREIPAESCRVQSSVADPDPNPDPDLPDRHVSGPPGSRSGSTSQKYGSGSFYHRAKIVRKTLIFTVL